MKQGQHTAEYVEVTYSCGHHQALERPFEPTGIYHKPSCVCRLCVPADAEAREEMCGKCSHYGYAGDLFTHAMTFEKHVNRLLKYYVVPADVPTLRFHEDTLLSLVHALHKTASDKLKNDFDHILPRGVTVRRADLSPEQQIELDRFHASVGFMRDYLNASIKQIKLMCKVAAK